MEDLVQLAGIAWDPHIRGVLVVATGFAVLCGSVYLLLSTNLGARLGFLLAAGGLFGWLTVLGLTWWIWPPAIGPRGHQPAWEVVDIAYGDPANSPQEVTGTLPNSCWSTISRDCEEVDGGTVASRLLSENPALQEELPEGQVTLSEMKSIDEEGVLDDLELGGWTLVSVADAGEPQSAASTALGKEGENLYEPADYILLDTFETGGKDPLPADANAMERLRYKIETAAQLQHPTHYAVVQLQPVIPQETEPGQAPPTPIPDEDAPVINVVMVRDLGNLRVPGFLVFAGSALMLGVIAHALHRRDQLADEHRAAAAGD